MSRPRPGRIHFHGQSPRSSVRIRTPGGAVTRRVVEYDEFKDIPDHDERDDDVYHGENIE